MREQYGMLSVRHDESVCVVTLNRPEKLNAMTNAFWTDLVEFLVDAKESIDTRVVVFHGAGPAFCVGGDIHEFGLLADIPARRTYQELAFATFHRARGVRQTHHRGGPRLRSRRRM